MNILRRSIQNSLLAVVPLLMLASCGGSTAEKEPSAMAKLTLAITDAPVDNAAAVNVVANETTHHDFIVSTTQ